MKVIDPHMHMVSRTTDDYRIMAAAGIRAVTEPAFWAGFDRGNTEAFRVYFDQLTRYEPQRAAQYGVRHFTWICLNPKEAEDLGLAAEVLSIIPEYLDRPNVLGVGEIGLNKNSRNELEVLERQLEIAAQHGGLVLVHTPHLEDKLKGTLLIMDAVRNQSAIRPERVLIDHAEEHTIGEILDRGYWCGITLYPVTKTSPARAIDMVDMYGHERLCMNSAADWGDADPLATLKAAEEMRMRGFSEEAVETIFWGNPSSFLGQSSRFELPC
ncbi:MAG: TatD family hydrolase [Holophagales bacterium]|nr:TatD family hydrolase [Holophagales bacterium]